MGYEISTINSALSVINCHNCD